MDDFCVGRADHMHNPSSTKERQVWLFYHRLGHPSFGYKQHLFPDLFSHISIVDFKSDTCILAKSH